MGTTIRRREIENVHARLLLLAIDLCKNGRVNVVPIELDIEASDSKLESMEILVRIECQPAYCRRTRKSLEELCQRVRHVGLCTAGINRDRQILLGFTK